jgi:hypothetical protein
MISGFRKVEIGSCPDAVFKNEPDAAKRTTLKGIEPTLSFNDIMAVYGWKYHKVYRYFIGHPRLGVKFHCCPN